MKLSVVLGAATALLVGVLALAGVLSTLSARQPTVPVAPTPTIIPGEFGLYTPPPTEVPTPAVSPDASAEPQPGQSASVGTQVGQLAPALELPHLAGGTLSSAAVEGPLWINFMATWCPSCQHELPMMQRVQLRNEELEIILVDVAEDGDTVLNFMLDLGVDLPVALDEDGAASRQWGAFALPVHYFIDADGIVQEVIFGGAPQEVIDAAIRTILPDARLPDPEE
jgi:cytochrome c biogenesis protein CcmG, thiol:disulfide interchange protein DsbE